MKILSKLLPVLFMVLFWLALPGYAQVNDEDATVPSAFKWPRVIETPQAEIVLYQPQLEDFSENRLHSRFAASIKRADAKEPVFGAVWMESRMETLREERTVHLVAIENVQSRFPNATPEEEKWFADVLKREIPTWDIVLSLDQLIAGLETEQERLKTEQALNNKPPKIIYTNKPAALVLVDGEPILQPIENTELMAVINTPFPMVFRKTDKTYYLIGKETWYKSKNVAGQWEETNNPPADIAALEREASDDEEAESAVTTGVVVFGATEPTELLSIDGDPQLVPFPGNNLMYVKNTNNDLLYEVAKGSFYLLLSGRWYRAGTLGAHWTYVPPDQLPEAFNDIPADSEKGNLRASVPGTEEAQEAVLDAQIPETAVVKRSEAKLDVEYDGKPEFNKISGTEIDYAVNTPTPVIRVKKKYYAVDNGIWFTAPSANGPWVVADFVPPEVQDIPPSSPVNNIKYVYVYDSTPEVVYVGYTPGYTGCYIHHGVVVYGTGYYYHPWYRHYYYPRPFTYGFNVHYSSYSGWSFGYSFMYGPFSFYFGNFWGPPRYGGWWGPPRYRPPYHRPPHHRPPSRPPGHRPPANRPPAAKPPMVKPPGKGKPSQLPAGQRPPNRPTSGNMYNKGLARPSGDSARPATMDKKDIRPTGKPAALPNNVYTDRQGNVYRKGQNGWEEWKDRKWQQSTGSRPTTPTQKPAQQPAGSTQKPVQRPSGSVQKPAQQPAGSGQKPTQRPTGSTQQPAQRPSGSVQRPAAQQPAGSGQQPVQRPTGSTQQPAQRPSGSVQQPARPSGGVQQPSRQPSQTIQQRRTTTQQPRSLNNQRRSLDTQQYNRNRGNQRTNQFYQNRQGGSAGRSAPRQGSKR